MGANPDLQAKPEAKWSLLALGKAHAHKLIALIIWLLILTGFWWYVRQNQLTFGEAIRNLVDLAAYSSIGPLIYIAVYAIRPLIFAPSALLSAAAGYLFGPVQGVVYAVIASNISAMVAYLVGRYFGQGILSSAEAITTINRYAKNLRQNSFEVLLVMRFLFLPYDLVSYVSGFLHINWQPFLLATFLGGLPGTTAFVLFGASIEGDFGGSSLPSLNGWTLAASFALFAGSLALSRHLKRHGKASKVTGQP